MLSYIRNSPRYALLEIGGKKYLLAHSIPEIEDFRALGGMQGLDRMDFTFNETDYDCVYDENVIMVSGHSPTGLIDPAFAGRILRRNNHIAIDCGAVFGYPMGCLCLETGEEFYV
jgi:serine/threonine protein phosphatase 1